MPTVQTRQVRRAQERKLVRQAMIKSERRDYVRMSRPARREVYYTLLGMIASGELKLQHRG